MIPSCQLVKTDVDSFFDCKAVPEASEMRCEAAKSQADDPDQTGAVLSPNVLAAMSSGIVDKPKVKNCTS